MKTEGIKVRVNDKEIGCLYSLGDIQLTRETSEKKCLSTGEYITIVNSVKTGNIDMGVTYDPTDTQGAGELEKVFNSGDKCKFEIELSDTAGNNGTTFTWQNAVVTEFSITPDDNGEVGAKFTIAPGGIPTVTAAS